MHREVARQDRPIIVVLSEVTKSKHQHNYIFESCVFNYSLDLYAIPRDIYIPVVVSLARGY